ncbi:MAG TPA: hypothetical protein VK183_14210 [Flavobacterium sp.]|nr:hypothetical protein [Flavobacterium sp.]
MIALYGIRARFQKIPLNDGLHPIFDRIRTSLPHIIINSGVTVKFAPRNPAEGIPNAPPPSLLAHSSMGNTTENRLDTTIAQADFVSIEAAVATIAAKLPAISLTDVQRQRMKRINVANKVFVEDAIHHVDANGAGVLPPYISATAMQTDLTLYEQADQIRVMLTALLQHIDDIRQVTGDELYSTALMAYRAFENAHKVGVPNATTAYQALQARFNGQGRAPDKELKK